SLPEYQGNTVFEANQPIIELLRARGVLMAVEQLTHSYPHCWRCHNPVIFRATEQWFIGMDLPVGGDAPNTTEAGETLRSKTLHEINNVRWDPAWGEALLSNMIETRPDWCISRQRVWGVPIAVLFCDECNEVLNQREVHRAIVRLFAEKGSDAWYSHSPEQIVPAGTRCMKCNGTHFRKEMDILDVWFEAGTSHAAVLGH